MKGDFEKAVKKMEKLLKDNFPDSTMALLGLSIKVGGMKGPIVEEDYQNVKNTELN